MSFDLQGVVVLEDFENGLSLIQVELHGVILQEVKVSTVSLGDR